MTLCNLCNKIVSPKTSFFSKIGIIHRRCYKKQITKHLYLQINSLKKQIKEKNKKLDSQEYQIFKLQVHFDKLLDDVEYQRDYIEEQEKIRMKKKLQIADILSECMDTMKDIHAKTILELLQNM